MKAWHPPVTGRQVSYLSKFDSSDGYEELFLGDYVGYAYRDHKNTNDGLATGFNGTATSGAFGSLTDSTAAFTTTGEGLSGYMVRIIDGTGEGQEKVIASNTATEIVPETNWTTPPDATSVYTVAGIDAYWRSKDYDFGGHDLLKLFRHVRLRCRESGNFNLTMHYIVDFRELAAADSKLIRLLDNGAAWDFSSFDSARWGAQSTIRRKVSLSNTASQSLNGTHLALRFYSGRANETFQISGYDIELNPLVGRR